MPCIGVTAEDRLSPLQGCSEPFEVPYLSRAARKAPPPPIPTEATKKARGSSFRSVSFCERSQLRAENGT